MLDHWSVQDYSQGYVNTPSKEKEKEQRVETEGKLKGNYRKNEKLCL